MKNPKIIVDDYSFLMYKKEPNQTTWYCTHYFNRRAVRCKCRIVTSGRVVNIYGEHCHEINKSKPDKYRNMLSQAVTIVRHPQCFTVK